MVPLRRRLRRALRDRGWELRRLPTEPEVPNADRWLRALDIATVLDIGANVGQFAAEARELFPAANIIAFEPLADCYEQLVAAGARLGRFRAHHLAIGATAGQATMHRSDFSQSSSLRPMGALHRDAFPFTAGSAPETVEVARLDDLDLELADPLLVKIDVQGFEDQVLAGGPRTVARAAVVLVETSYVPLYEGGPLFADIAASMDVMGFRYSGARGVLTDPRDGRPLQENSIFLPDPR
jgi:FkbM family methyltransferase